MFIDAYEAQIARKQYTPDPAQYEAAQQFQLVFDHLTRHSRAKMLISDRLRRLKSGASWVDFRLVAVGLSRKWKDLSDGPVL